MIQKKKRASKNLFGHLKKPSKQAEWDSVRAKLKEEFYAKGIVTCELRWKGCWVNSALGFAHSKRRRFIKTDEELREVLLICQNCHMLLDDKHTHEETEKIVLDVIKSRDGKVY